VDGDQRLRSEEALDRLANVVDANVLMVVEREHLKVSHRYLIEMAFVFENKFSQVVGSKLNEPISRQFTEGSRETDRRDRRGVAPVRV
jgi:hypothetical protein